jgi:hypothetical protein
MAKKLCLFLGVLLIFSLWQKPSTVFEAETGNYSFYIGNASSTCEIVTTTAANAKSLRKSLKNVCGESLQTQDGEAIDGEVERLKANLVFEEVANGIVLKYYYSDKISTYKSINGTKVNLQTANDNGLWTIGTPLIFGSF